MRELNDILGCIIVHWNKLILKTKSRNLFLAIEQI